MVRNSVRGLATLAICVSVVLPVSLLASVTAARADAAAGPLVIRLIVTPAEPDARARFAFGISCTGDAAPVERRVEVVATKDGGSVTADGLAVDMACLVTAEPADGWRLESASPQAVVASAEGTTVEFAYRRRAAAAISVLKTSEPSGASAADATPSFVQRGSRISYTLTYRNDGDLPADATLADTIPAGTAYAGRALCRPACARIPTVSDGKIQFDMPVGPGKTGRVSYAVLVADDAADGDMVGSHATAEPGRGRSGTVLHRVAVQPAGLKVMQQADLDSAPEGATVGYTIDVVNSGSAVQEGVTVTTELPTTAQYVDSSATCAAPCSTSYDAARSVVTWRVGPLEPGESTAGLSYRVKIKALIANPDGSLPGTVVLSSAVASSPVTPTVRSNEVKTVVEAVLGRKAVRPKPAVKVTRPAATQGSAPTLPATGVPVGLLLALGAGLIAAGASLLSVGRGERPGRSAAPSLPSSRN